MAAFERIFAARGLPNAIRTDNGLPFASPNGLLNLSKLSVWWLRLGIAIERIKPGHPQQNGRHERMHLTLKQHTARPPATPSSSRSASTPSSKSSTPSGPIRPLAMQRPADLYRNPAKPYQGLPDVEYPLHDRDILVTACGRICIHKKKINLSTVLAGQRVGLKEVDDAIWRVSFITYDLGYIDQPRDNPFGTRLLPMS